MDAFGLDAPTGKLLLEGRMPASEADVLALLSQLGIAHHTVYHPPVRTVEEAKRHRGEVPGSHIKNLFLRNKKGRMWLITCHEDRHIDLKALAGLVGAGRFSFASAERLMRYLGVLPGAVTPLAPVNDHSCAVQVVLDEKVLRDELLNVHPLHNGATTALAPTGLLTFLQAVKHEPLVVDMDPLAGC